MPHWQPPYGIDCQNACRETGRMAGPFDLDPFLQRMAALDRADIVAATIAEIDKYDRMQRSAKGAMRAATREHRLRLAAFLANAIRREWRPMTEGKYRCRRGAPKGG